MTLTPEAFVQLYSEMVDEARKAGWPGMENSLGFLSKIDLEYDAKFKKEPAPKEEK